MRKDKTSSLKSLNASCKLFHCSYWILYVVLPSSSRQQRLWIRQLLHHILYSWQVPPTLQHRRRWVLREEIGGGGPGSTRSPPLQPAPARSLRQLSLQTSGRRWRPDETCSSSPRLLSSTVWFPAQGKGGGERKAVNVIAYWLLIHDSWGACQ